MQREFQFYIVPTPIGNLDDITLRTIEVLKSVDLIACEDSRVTQNLLNHFNIKTKLISYHKYNEKSRVEELLSYLNSGKKIALVSDAGTPMICDPGSVLIEELRKNDISISSLAGACAIPTFLSQVPRENEFFTFVGFFPKTSQKSKDILLKYSDTNLVFYESPNRILDTLRFIKEIRGEVKIALARELTKLFEEVVIDDVSKVLDHYNDGIKGEIVCMVYPNSSEEGVDFNSQIELLKEKGFKSKEISVILSTLYNVNKNNIYKMITENK
jgi:16S rRNA (cytidine1402-2'-O)-methyltransferase